MPFLPSGFNLPLAWAVDFSLPLLIKLYQDIEGIDIEPEDREKLRTLRKGRLILCCNHPSLAESAIAYHIAQKMGSRFQYLTSQTEFDRLHGVMGQLAQGLGAVAFENGPGDPAAREAVREIFTKPAGKMVLFPEGDPESAINDILLPFMPDSLRLAYEGLMGAHSVETGADISALPCMIKYSYTGTDAKIKGDMNLALRKLERRYGLNRGTRNILQRFLSLARSYLEEAEKEYGIEIAQRRDFDYRAGQLRNHILRSIAKRLGLTEGDIHKEESIAFRHFSARLDSIVAAKVANTSAWNANQNSNITLDDAAIETLRTDLRRVQDFLVLRPEHLISRPSADRLYEWLARFEVHISGSSDPRTRRATVHFGEPFSISACAGADVVNQEGSAESAEKFAKKFGLRLRKEMQLLLEQSLEVSMPILRPYDVGEDAI